MNNSIINNIKRFVLKSILPTLPLGGVGGGLLLLRGGLVGLFVGLLFSCSDWDDHYENSSSEGSDISLWEKIEANSQLSDFAEVLTQTKVFRQHKKTATSYADLLKGGQSLTVLAPVNGTFNKDSLISLTQTAKGDSAVEHFFVMNHITRTPRSLVDGTFRTLNNKKTTFSGNAVNGITVTESNERCKNGILHVLQSQIPYTHTIYETFTQIDGFKSIGTRINRYNEDYFDESASVSSGLVDGIPVYVDSVITERNKLINSIGLINSEDSTYWVCAPTDEGWNKAWNEAANYFYYSSDLEKADSLREYWTTRSLLEDAIFSKTVQGSPNDSVVSPQYSKSTPNYHRFYHPYAADGIFGKASGTRNCSNGTLYYYNEWPFDPTETYFKKIEQEGEYTWNIISYTGCAYSSRSLVADSISKGAYCDIKATGGNTNWKIKYKLSNTLSGKYDFCVVVLPKTVEDPEGNMRPCKFKVAINYIDSLGQEQSYNCENQEFTSDPSKVDTIVVAEGFQLPACNYNQSNEKINIEIQCSIKANQNTKYNREMYLDAIFLRPKK